MLTVGGVHERGDGRAARNGEVGQQLGQHQHEVQLREHLAVLLLRTHIITFYSYFSRQAKASDFARVDNYIYPTSGKNPLKYGSIVKSTDLSQI